MNRYLVPVLYILIVAVSSCQLDIEPGTPGCIQEQIKEFSKSKIPCDDGKSVSSYNFQGKIVFIFDPGVCGNDLTSEVIDSNCNSLGFLGGIAGNIVISGEEFSNAILISTVWEH